MRRVLGTMAAVIFAVGLGFSGTGEVAQAAAEAPGDARFEFLKGLSGTWSGVPGEDGSPGITFEFNVTAGGSAVEVREMAGTPMEMVTLYHLDGSDLVATHYCMLGNRPVLNAADRLKDGALAFECSGTPGGSASHDEQHVHGWTLALAEDGTLHIDVKIAAEGETAESPSFVLSRQAAH